MEMPDKPCPRCGAVGGLSIENNLIATPSSSKSLSGSQTKVSTTIHPVLVCTSCEMYHFGAYDNGFAIFEPIPLEDDDDNS